MWHERQDMLAVALRGQGADTFLLFNWLCAFDNSMHVQKVYAAFTESSEMLPKITNQNRPAQYRFTRHVRRVLI